MTIREEKPSITSSNQINKKRKLSTEAPIDRKSKAKIPGHLIKFGSYEIGLTEGSEIEDGTSNKFFMDSMVKCPKLLKNMIMKLIEVAPHKRRSLRTLGLITSKLDLMMMMMDAPEGYVYRVLRTNSYRYPVVYDLFVKEIRCCLDLVWMAQIILEDTVDDLISPTPHQTITFKSSTAEELPTFYQ